jgi:hypothetical protein
MGLDSAAEELSGMGGGVELCWLQRVSDSRWLEANISYLLAESVVALDEGVGETLQVW